MDSIIDFVTLAIILHQELFIWYIQIKSGFKSKFISNGRRIAFDCTSVMVIIFLEMLLFWVLIIVHQFILISTKIVS